jgi:hypothetical protein
MPLPRRQLFELEDLQWQPIGIFEIAERTMTTIVPLLFTPLFVLRQLRSFARSSGRAFSGRTWCP